VIDVAAAGWKETVKLRLNDTSLWMSFRGFMETASKVSRTRDWEGKRLSAAKETDFISDIPAEFLVPEGWEDDPDDSPDDRKLTIAAREALREFHQAAGLKNPPSYYAIIALDGDEIGKFLSGEKAPEVGKLLSRKANEYFSRIAPDWLKAKRPLSPSYHLGFSEALGNFGLYAARRVVEAHHGQLIYSGGDDVLAAVPADEAFACVRGLRWAFQGSHQLAQQYQEQFAPAPVEGMIQLAAPDNHEPSWPLLVPGSAMTVSAGIVIAHVKTPLQDCVQAAHAAEKRAKRARDAGGFARNAVALTLLKRSGETIEWGASFAENGGLELLMEFQRLYRLPKGIAGKFPSRIAGLLSRFDSVPEGLKLTSEIREVVIREIEWAWDQMESAKVLQGNKAGFFKLIDGYLNHLIEHGRPLADVWKLFGTEAFLKRQSV
jgi:hypothetical protein